VKSDEIFPLNVLNQYTTNWNSTKDYIEGARKVLGQSEQYNPLKDRGRWMLEPRDIALSILRHQPFRSKLFEIGCGVGRVSHHLTGDFDTYCTDLFPSMLRLNTAQVIKLPFGGGFSVTGVLFCYVLQHCPPAVMEYMIEYLNRNTWKYIYMLESIIPSDFSGYNFRDGLYEMLNCEKIEEREWHHELNVTWVTLRRRDR